MRRNPGKYETVQGQEPGKEVVCLKGEVASVSGQTFTEQELRNIEKAAAKMNDRED